MNNTKQFTPHPSIPCQKCGNSFMHDAHVDDWEYQYDWLQFWVSNETRLPSKEEIHIENQLQRNIVTTADILGHVQGIVFDHEVSNIEAIFINHNRVRIIRGAEKLLLDITKDGIYIVYPLTMHHPFSLEELHTFLEKWLT